MSSSPTAEPATVFILSVSSDIGEQLALDYLRRGWSVAGTFRTSLPESLREHERFSGLRCDAVSSECGALISEFMRARAIRWDIFISCIGQLAPVGPFFECDFESWAHSVETNGVAQLRALHAAHPFRQKARVCHVVFFAGGGTNNPFRHYSAYCLGKIALIKMCELLDDENPDLNVFIVGTGWVRTKIHEQTLAAGPLAGDSYAKTRSFLDQKEPGTDHREIAAMIRWGIEQGRAVAGGRNFSVVHDPWAEAGSDLAAALLADSDKFKLRRHGNRAAQPHRP
jgi:NAD(P)-dependent dehydrogenase (short-subunit alcohol dehydrogenase family)